MTYWEEQIELPEKDPEVEYAYILKSSDEPLICSKEKLYKVIEENDDVVYVTTPQNSTFIIPGSDFETLQPILKKRKSSIKANLYMGIAFTIFIGAFMLLFSLDSNKGFWAYRSSRINMLIFGILPILNALYELFSIRRINAINYQKESSEIKFNFWLNQEINYSIYIVTGIIIVITFIQLITGLRESIEFAGLVKPKTLNGEYWRLLRKHHAYTI